MNFLLGLVTLVLAITIGIVAISVPTVPANTAITLAFFSIVSSLVLMTK